MSENEARPLLVLVDGHARAYRAYFALKAANFHTSTGEITNAIYGFTSLILDILEENPTYFAISFDRGMSGREELYSEYKGTREKMPDDLAQQLTRIEELVKTFNIPVLALDGFEADDIIGTVTRQAEEMGCDVRIVTGDRDILQLISDHTRVLLPGWGGPDIEYGPAEYAEKYPGLTPAQLPDFKGIVGDSSDNIPGVAGVGEKGALGLLQAYGTIENLYDHVAETKGSLRTKLEAGREMAFLSKKLATILCDLPIELDLEACVTHDFDPIAVDMMFQELEFRSFRRRLQSLVEKMQKRKEEGDKSDPSKPQIVVTIVDTEEKLAAMVKELNAAKLIAFDTETTGVDQMACNLVGISLAVEGTHGYYIPVGHIAVDAPKGELEGAVLDGGTSATSVPSLQSSLLELAAAKPVQLPLKQVLDAIRPALTNPQIEKMAHNAKFDMVVLRRYDIDVSPVTIDTMLVEWLVKPDETARLGLKDLALSRLNIHMTRIDELIGTGKKKTTMSRVPIADAGAYAVVDAAIMFPLHDQLLPELNADRTAYQLFDEMEMPLVPVIADMEMHGVLLDVPFLGQLSRDLNQRLTGLEEEIFATANCGRFNINSLNQLGDVLFNKLRLSTKGLKKTKTGNWSLTADVLESMANEHPIIPLLQDYRQLTKLQSTYVDALPALINQRTGRVHTSYNQTGATTGRFSSSDPNLQNIPIRSEEGRRVRQAFIAPPNHKLLSVDYSQVELRILAHYSDDETLISAFEQGLDIHASTAAAVNRIPIDQVTFEQRSFAKSVNFGLMYGMGAFRLARDSELTLAEARDFITAYFERFPGVKRYLDGSKAFAAQHGYVETLRGRRRNFPILQNPLANMVMLQRAEREAINMPIQGTAADIIKIAMVNLAAALKEGGYRSQMILQVHDELVLEVPDEELEKVAPLVVHLMESAMTLKVPLRADANVGMNWRKMASYRSGR